ncbi:MAG: hypothetical protein HY897_25365 [Deltaproteobacteria bacterium]|nr:hypothetical protein [Deltaproteobacteria bacterium]
MKTKTTKTERKTCAACREHRALFQTAGRVRWDRFHDVCLECYRALRNHLRAASMAVAAAALIIVGMAACGDQGREEALGEEDQFGQAKEEIHATQVTPIRFKKSCDGNDLVVFTGPMSTAFSCPCGCITNNKKAMCRPVGCVPGGIRPRDGAVCDPSGCYFQEW